MTSSSHHFGPVKFWSVLCILVSWGAAVVLNVRWENHNADEHCLLAEAWRSKVCVTAESNLAPCISRWHSQSSEIRVCVLLWFCYLIWRSYCFWPQGCVLREEPAWPKYCSQVTVLCALHVYFCSGLALRCHEKNNCCGEEKVHQFMKIRAETKDETKQKWSRHQFKKTNHIILTWKMNLCPPRMHGNHSSSCGMRMQLACWGHYGHMDKSEEEGKDLSNLKRAQRLSQCHFHVLSCL